MSVDVTTITNKIVNCYLVKTDDGFFMVDTGLSLFKGALKKTLVDAGCKPGSLKLVIITHGDYDHTGNAAYLRKKYGAKVAVHRKEAGAVEQGDMFSSRKRKWKASSRIMLGVFKLIVFHPVKPDIYIDEERDLNENGVDVRIIHIPGHSLGSIGVLTGEGDFFCGDLLVNNGEPTKNRLVDDEKEIDASIERLKDLGIGRIYPGHGRPFTMEEFFKNTPR